MYARSKMIFLAVFVIVVLGAFFSFSLAQTDSRETLRDRFKRRIAEKTLQGKDKNGVERGLGGIDARVDSKWIDQPGDYGPGEYARKFQFGGLERFYKIHVPPGYDKNKPAPVVLCFHGGGGYPDSVRYNTGFDKVSDENGFILVLPAGTGKYSSDRLLLWNDGRPDKDGKFSEVDDVGFVNALLDDLPKYFNVDTSRIYACGFSNGAQFSYTLANKLSNRIAAIACVAGHRTVDQYFPAPPRPISVMQFSGMQDEVAPYYGGLPPEKAGSITIAYKFTMKPVKEAVESWAKHNGCSLEPSETKRIGKAVMRRYGPGNGDTEAVLWALEDGGHTIPGGKLFPSEVDSGLGNVNQDIYAPELMWEFFKRQALNSDVAQDGYTLGPGDYEFRLNYDKLIRSYLVHVPSAYDKNKPFPAVLNFHGGGGSAEGFRKMTGMDETSDNEGFILVYPKGMRIDGNPDKIFARFWNPGKGPNGAYNKDPLLSQVDDVGFVNTMLDDLESKFNIDKNRIYACGLSNGAALLHLLACRLSGRIAAIGVVAGPFWNDPAQCALKRPVPVIYFHGTDDRCLLYNGGPCGCEAGIAGRGRVYISAEETVEIWRVKNGCSKEPQVTYQSGDVTCKTYKECAQSAEVTFCTIAGGGHTWPGGKPYKIPGLEIGKVSYDISANEAIWEFFKKHPIEKN